MAEASGVVVTLPSDCPPEVVEGMKALVATVLQKTTGTFTVEMIGGVPVKWTRTEHCRLGKRQPDKP